MPITISKPIKEDAVGVQEVFYRTRLDTYPNDVVGITKEDIETVYKDAFTPESIKRRAEGITTSSSNRLFVVAKEGDKVVGVCSAYIRESFNQLQAIYILPEYQHQGIGQALFTKVLNFFDKEKSIIVHVADYNLNAISFYSKLGFVDTGKRFTEERHTMPVTGTQIPELEMVMKQGSW